MPLEFWGRVSFGKLCKQLLFLLANAIIISLPAFVLEPFLLSFGATLLFVSGNFLYLTKTPPYQLFEELLGLHKLSAFGAAFYEIPEIAQMQESFHLNRDNSEQSAQSNGAIKHTASCCALPSLHYQIYPASDFRGRPLWYPCSDNK